MGKERLAAFSDGVLAIIITIMVLEFQVPHGTDFAALRPLLPVLLSYVLSFLYIGIYWNNHHHLFSVTDRVNGTIMWANMHLLFWLSLVPFATEWAGRNHFAPVPTGVYGIPLLMASLAYWLLQSTLLRMPGQNPVLEKALGDNLKGKLSPALSVLAIACAFAAPKVADGIYVLVALMWLIPDRRIENAVMEPNAQNVKEITVVP